MPSVNSEGNYLWLFDNINHVLPQTHTNRRWHF